MANKKSTEPQRQFYTQGISVSPDVDKLYTSIIKEIDSHRSYFGISPETKQNIKDKQIDDILSTGSGPQKEHQESRCHAFYRMMGLPVIDANGVNFYSPGHDPSLNKDTKRIEKNLGIAASFASSQNMAPLSTLREYKSQNSNTAFALGDEFATASLLAISILRQFDKQLTPDLEPIDYDSQIFTIPNRTNDLVKDLPIVNFQSVQDVQHILKPFVVDPSIELTVSPAQNRICAPFLENKAKTQITQNNYLIRPYIERVISVRFKSTNTILNNNVYINEVQKFITDNSKINDSNILQINKDLKNVGTAEIKIIGKFIQLFDGLITELVDDIILVDKTRAEINYKPIPNKKGIEFGITTNKINYEDPSNRQIELDLWSQEFNKSQAQVEPDSGFDHPDNNSFAFSNVDDIIFGGEKDDQAFIQTQIKKMTETREEKAKKANDALLHIEMLVGEFSGFGILDALAVQLTFWLMDPEALLGLIDDAAFARLTANKSLMANLSLPQVRLGLTKSLKDFEKKISEIFSLIQSFYVRTLSGELKQ